jgi:hypothetical protein
MPCSYYFVPGRAQIQKRRDDATSHKACLEFGSIGQHCHTHSRTRKVRDTAPVSSIAAVLTDPVQSTIGSDPYSKPVRDSATIREHRSLTHW